MKIVEPSFVIEDEIDGIKILKKLESAARNCYKSENLVTEDSYKAIIKRIIDSHHDSVLEHESITVRFICDRGISHELVRHRIASFSQESTRYANYSKDKFGNEISVILPALIKSRPELFDSWLLACSLAEQSYMYMLDQGISPQIARSVLPTCLKTEIVVTANVREWKHIFEQRTDKAAHPQMRQLMCPLLKEFRNLIPIIYDNIGTTDI
ncbi:MAG: FAD-dependent thymidylate synthase [Patescibacteria group bacterium]